jgi:hypothetical protein
VAWISVSLLLIIIPVVIVSLSLPGFQHRDTCTKKNMKSQWIKFPKYLLTSVSKEIYITFKIFDHFGDFQRHRQNAEECSWSCLILEKPWDKILLRTFLYYKYSPGIRHNWCSSLWILCLSLKISSFRRTTVAISILVERRDPSSLSLKLIFVLLVPLYKMNRIH